MAAIPVFIAIPGINVTFWMGIGLVRFFQEEILQPQVLTRSEKNLTSWMGKNTVAVCIAARNEEHGISRTIRSLVSQVGKKNIYVASDGSTDATVKIARGFGVKVVDLQPNRGKAGAMAFLIDHFNLLEKFLFILFVDADTHINRDYLKNALPLFADPEVVVVAGHGKTAWHKHKRLKLKNFFISYRDRLYNFLQVTFRYGQTTKWLNVSPIVPGFASIYRASVLKKIDITTPGLVIEDFNMTFQIHHQNLGKIAYHPKVYGIARDPTSFIEYVKQVKRWNLGFWQTVIRHGFWPSLFSVALVFFIFESFLAAIFFVLIPVVVLVLAIQPASLLNSYIDLVDILIVLIVADYLLTVVVAIFVKRWQHLIYGLGFPLLRIVDALLILISLPQALFTSSKGSWTPAKRK